MGRGGHEPPERVSESLISSLCCGKNKPIPINIMPDNISDLNDFINIRQFICHYSHNCKCNC